MIARCCCSDEARRRPEALRGAALRRGELRGSGLCERVRERPASGMHAESDCSGAARSNARGTALPRRSPVMSRLRCDLASSPGLPSSSIRSLIGEHPVLDPAPAVPGSRGLGFELDPGVYQLTKRNLALIGAPIDVANVDFAAGLSSVVAPDGQVIVFVAPPWGDALDPVRGLDLRRTQPPVADILDMVADRFPNTPLLFAIQVFERIEPSSVADASSRSASSLTCGHLNAAVQSHGLLLGTRAWIPAPADRRGGIDDARRA